MYLRTAINPPYRTSRRAKALGYARQSPPARAMADYLLKDHKPSAMRGEARLRGLEWNNYSKTIIATCLMVRINNGNRESELLFLLVVHRGRSTMNEGKSAIAIR